MLSYKQISAAVLQKGFHTSLQIIPAKYDLAKTICITIKIQNLTLKHKS